MFLAGGVIPEREESSGCALSADDVRTSLIIFGLQVYRGCGCVCVCVCVCVRVEGRKERACTRSRFIRGRNEYARSITRPRESKARISSPRALSAFVSLARAASYLPLLPRAQTHPERSFPPLYISGGNSPLFLYGLRRGFVRGASMRKQDRLPK